MKTWFTSDLHLGHARIVELSNRPFADVDEMNAALIENINASVSSEDRLVVLGDICMGKLEDSLKLLGEIRARELVLVPGNHDRWSLAYGHNGDAAAKREDFRLRYERTRPHTVTLRDGEPSCWHFPELTLVENPVFAGVLFSHYPYDGDTQGEDRAGFLRAEDAGAPIIHGHCHTEWAERGRQFNVGVDVRDFKPVSEDEIAAWIHSL